MAAINQQVVQGRWNEIKGSLRERWGQLSDDDLQVASGNVDQLIGVIQQKTGQSRERIEAYLAELTDEGNSRWGRAMDSVSHAAESAGSQMSHAAASAQRTARDAYYSAEETLGQRALESTLIGFATGMMIGLAIGLSVRSR